MKKTLLLSLLAALLPPFAAEAKEVAEPLAARAAKAWVDRGCALGKIPGAKAVAAVRTLVDPETGAELRVVSFEGGGWVVTSADDRIDPVLAFSEKGDGVDPDERNPFWALLRADIAAREAAAGVGREKAGRKDGAAAEGSTADTASASRRWADLLGDGTAAKEGEKSLDSVSDLRVDALMQTEWSQDKAGGKYCWNYYTPNHYVCGCVATAYAQIMRKWCRPTSYVTPQTKTCSVDGSARSFTMKGGYYDWSNMPLKPSYSNVPTDAQCQAIGKLAFDVGVGVEMDWASDGSGAPLSKGCSALRNIFGYASAVSISYWGSYSLGSFRNSVCPNLDAGCPVSMSVGRAHAVVADGYGFSNGDYFIHVNYGWGGYYDAWYCPPDVTPYSSIDGIGCNISPDSTGSILSGRVMGSGGGPVPGASVSLSDGQSTTTDAHGIYAFWARGGTYTVSASKNGSSASLGVSVGPSQTGTTDGNSWGNDLTLSTSGGSAPAAPTGVSASDGGYTDKVYVSWSASSGATSYTVHRSTSSSGTKTTLGSTTSTSWSDTTATAGTTYYYWVKASNSAGTSGFSSYDTGYRASAPSRPGNDDFANAYSVSGSSGSTSGSNANATTQTGEPSPSAQGSSGASVWWRWTAPGNGTAVFDTIGSSFDTVLAVYTGSSVSSLSEICSDDDGADNNCSRCSFSATSGTTYRIAVRGYSSGTGSIALNWSFTASATTPAAPTGVSASDGGYTDKVYVSWSASSGATSYTVYRSTSSSGTKTTLGSTTSTYWNDTGATVGTTYYYWVKASNSAGTSGFSSYDTGYRASASSRPGNDDFANAYSVSGSSGSTSGSNEDATVQTGEPTPSSQEYSDASVWWRWTAPGTGFVSFDTIGSDFDTVLSVYTGSSLSSLSEVASDDDSGGANNTSRCTFSVTSGTTYRISVRGYSSNTGSIALNWSFTSSSTAPSAPSWVEASDGWYDDYVYVEWASSAAATYYDVYRSTSYSGSKTYLSWTDSTYYYDYDAEPGTTYYYWIVAANDYGTSGYSDCDSGYCAEPETAPDAPSWVDASDGTYTTKVLVEWGSSEGATSYEVLRAASSYGTKTSIGTTSSTYWNDTTATAGTTYYYWVRASNGAGTSGYSACDSGWRARGGSSSGRKFALCVGINRYSDDYGQNRLAGCVNDAKYFRNNLVGLGGWSLEDTTLLANSRATRGSIRAAMADYASRAVAGDTFVYMHSSHGGWYSGTSVCLCSYDADYPDTELAADLARFRSGVKVVVIVDACHSGGLFKGRRRKAPEFDLADRVTAILDETRKKEVRAGAKGASAKISSSEIGWVTAADYDESSWDGAYYEDGGWATGGVFLTRFTEGWWSGDADSGYDGDGDGLFDAYEGWSYSYDYCVDYGFDRDEYFTPQYRNVSVLRSVELGECSRPPAPGRPANDDFSGARILSGTSGLVEGTNVRATTEDDEWANHSYAGSSVWWTWTAPATGTARFSTAGSDLDTILSVYEGDSYDWMTTVATDDDSGGDLTSVVSFQATAGTTYRIAVYGYGDNQSDIWLSWQSGIKSVYRFYSKGYRGHFFTIDEGEMWNLRRTNPNWRYEGSAYFGFRTQEPGTVPVYRFYSKGYRGHFFTISEGEMWNLRRTNPNWRYEGIAYYVYPNASMGGMPVYRFWSKGYRHHFFTTSRSERDSLIYGNPNWKYEGVAFYALNAGGTSPWSDWDDDWDDYAAGPTDSPSPALGGRSSGKGSAVKAARGGAPASVPVARANDRVLSPAHCGAGSPELRDQGVAWTLSAEGGTAIAACGSTEVGGVLVETRGDVPSREELEDSRAESVRRSAFGVRPFRLSLPPGIWNATLWSAADATVADEESVGTFEFDLPANGAWHWLRICDGTDEDAFSLWLRAE